MNLTTLFYLIVLSATLVLPLPLLLSKGRDFRNIVFSLIVLSTSAWILTSMLTDLEGDYDTAVSLARITIIGPSFTPSLFLLFSWLFPSKQRVGWRRILSLLIPPAIILPFINTDANVISISKESWGTSVTGGWLYYIIFFFYLFYFSWAYRNIYISIGQATLLSVKRQLQLIIIGLTLSLSVSLVTNVILVIFGDNGASLFGPPSTIFFVGATALAIIRYRFLDIRLIVGRFIYYTVLTTLPYGLFFGLSVLYYYWFGSSFDIRAMIVSIPIGYLFVNVYGRFNEFIRTQVNSRLINPGYNPLETVEKLSNQLSVMIDLEGITSAINGIIAKTIRPDFSAVVIFKDEDHPEDRVLASSASKTFTNLAEIETTVITLWKNVGKHPIVQDQIQIEILDGIYRNVPHIVNQLEKFMIDNGIKLILGIGEHESIIGLFFVGQKEADTAYNSIDTDFLKSVTNTGASAIQRSLLYSEVQEFNRTLQKKVDDATAALKTTNAELAKTLEQVQELRRQERDMVDIMGHELRTPISIVRNALVMLQMQLKGSSDAKVVKYVEMGLESARREIKLIETLLSATKVEGNRIQLDFTKVDLTDVINDSLEGNRGMAKDKKLEIKYTPPTEPINVYCDRVRVQEVMDNFLSNALKYTPKGTVEISVNIDQAKSMAYVSVKDNGIGIAAEDLDRLGRKFFRAKQYVSKDGKAEESVVRPGGTGLGLYVTFEFIRLMGGERKIESKVGEGSTFTFGMPLFNGQPDKHLDQTFMPGQNYANPAQAGSQNIIQDEPKAEHELQAPRIRTGINLLK